MSGTSPDFLWLFIRMIIGLVVVLGLALLLIRYVLPKAGKNSKTNWAGVVGRVMLEPRKGLYLVKIVGRYFVLGSTDQNLSLISELSKEEGEKIETT